MMFYMSNLLILSQTPTKKYPKASFVCDSVFMSFNRLRPWKGVNISVFCTSIWKYNKNKPNPVLQKSPCYKRAVYIIKALMLQSLHILNFQRSQLTLCVHEDCRIRWLKCQRPIYISVPTIATTSALVVARAAHLGKQANAQKVRNLGDNFRWYVATTCCIRVSYSYITHD